jgi:AcrR family transcriptional regulator
MPPPVRTPPDKWIEEGLRALAAGGPDAIRVEALARALGVTKGSFYRHFDDRPALLDEMLDAWERLVIDQVIERVESEGGGAKDKLRRLFALASSPAGRLIQIDVAIREWARRDPRIGKRLKRVDNRRMDYMRTLFGAFCRDRDEVDFRCMIVLSLMAGVPLVAADPGRWRRADLHREVLERLLLS